MKAIYFTIEELVDRDTFGTYGEKAWDFLHPLAIGAIDGIREFFDTPVIVNTWHRGGVFQYRGYRPSHCPVGLETSYHRRGMAFDFDVTGIDSGMARAAILNNKTNPLLWKVQRLEAGVNWVHMDIGAIPDFASRIYLFRA